MYSLFCILEQVSSDFCFSQYISDKCQWLHVLSCLHQQHCSSQTWLLRSAFVSNAPAPPSAFLAAFCTTVLNQWGTWGQPLWMKAEHIAWCCHTYTGMNIICSYQGRYTAPLNHNSVPIQTEVHCNDFTCTKQKTEMKCGHVDLISMCWIS